MDSSQKPYSGNGIRRSADQASPVATLAAGHSQHTNSELMSRIIWWLAILACLAACWITISRIQTRSTDSWFPMVSAFDFIHSHQVGLVYDTLFFHDHIKFQYPPTSLLLLELLQSFGVTPENMLVHSDPYAAPILNSLNAVFLVLNAGLIALLATKLLGVLHLWSIRVPLAPLVFLISLVFAPNYWAFDLGQIQVLLTFLFLLACVTIYCGNRAFTGVFIGLASLVKPQFALLALIALARRDWKFISGFAITVVPLTLLSFALYRIDNHLDYLKVLSFLSSHGEWTSGNQSINGFLNRFFYTGPSLDYDPSAPNGNTGFPPYIPAVYYGTLFSSLVLICVPFLLPYRRGDRVIELHCFTLAATLFTMASPIAWLHHYSVIAPAYIVTLALILRRPPRGIGLMERYVIVASFCLTVFRSHRLLTAPTDPLSPVQAAFFIGVCLLIGIMVTELVCQKKEADLAFLSGNPIQQRSS